MQPLLLGIDVGTTHIKAAVFDCTGHMVSLARVRTPTHYPQPGWAHYEPDEIWQGVLEVVRSALLQIDHPQRVVGVACASMGEAGVPVDEQGHPLYPFIAWFDQRSQPQAAMIATAIGPDVIAESTGLNINPIFSLCKILWIRENHPDIYKRTFKWLNVSDYISYKLSGIYATDYSLASRTLSLNLNSLQWDLDILKSINIKNNIFANLLCSGTKLGFVLPEVASITGLPKSAIVSVGGHDHVCAALALGITTQGTILDSMGSAEALFLPIEQARIDPELCCRGYTYGAHVAGGYYVLAGLFASGIAVEWFQQFAARDISVEALIEEATLVPAGSLGAMFVPHLRTANTPHNDPTAMGAFVGLTTDTQRGALFRAVLEGLAMETHYALDVLNQKYNLSNSRLLVTGGSIKNKLFLHIKSNVFGKPIIIKSVEEATALGAALLGGVGAGIYASPQAAADAIQVKEEVVANEQNLTNFYALLYQNLYKYLYEFLKPINQKINSFKYSVKY